MKPASIGVLTIGLLLGLHPVGADARNHRVHTRQHGGRHAAPHTAVRHAHHAARVYNDSNYDAHAYSGRGSKPKSFVPRPRTKPPAALDR